jgi:hypothetical protein
LKQFYELLVKVFSTLKTMTSSDWPAVPGIPQTVSPMQNQVICFRLKHFLRSLLVLTSLMSTAVLTAEAQPSAFGMQNVYPEPEQRLTSPGDTTFYVDPVSGNDNHSGTNNDQAWRTFVPVNARLFAPGDRIEIIRPGAFYESLMPMGSGRVDSPVEIHFAPGRYDFFPGNALKLKLNISNDNDTPESPKAIAMMFQDTHFFRISGDKTDFYIHGKMIEVMLDHATDMKFTNVSFDYDRPTVSELRILSVNNGFAEVQIQRDSTYGLSKGKLVWLGEGWQSFGFDLCQEYDPAGGHVWRRDSPLAEVSHVDELSKGRLRLYFDHNPGFIAGHIFQFRDVRRDCVGVFMLRSRDIAWEHCHFYFMHGLGLVAQFSENLDFKNVDIAPRPGSGRTCAGWADLLHFSGCRGLVRIQDCHLEGMNDDAVNVHGTFLRIMNAPKPDQVLLRFMHWQSYGFEAFSPGDDIEFVSHTSLRGYQTNQVKSVMVVDEKDVLLTLESPIPDPLGAQDVVENMTWTPSVEITGCSVSVDSCRGFLLSTLRPIRIINNTFVKTTMSAILIADDANSWFESGEVRDVLIQSNRFVKCAEPVIAITPENITDNPDEPVHRHIQILNNLFDLTGQNAISARSVDALTIRDNSFSASRLPVQTVACTNLIIDHNRLGWIAETKQ